MFLIACWLAVGGETQEGDGKGLHSVCWQAVPARWLSQGGCQEASVYLSGCSPSLTWHSTAFQASHWHLLQCQCPQRQKRKNGLNSHFRNMKYMKSVLLVIKGTCQHFSTPPALRDVCSRVPATTMVNRGIIMGAGMGEEYLSCILFLFLLGCITITNSYWISRWLLLGCVATRAAAPGTPRHCRSPVVHKRCQGAPSAGSATQMPELCSRVPEVSICISMPELDWWAGLHLTPE